MARLVVEAVSREYSTSDLVWHLQLFVSVSRADDGTPVTGLELDNFRVCSAIGGVLTVTLSGGYEGDWEPLDVEPAGCYSLSVTRKWEKRGAAIQEWTEGEFYSFGVQARVENKATGETDVGQGVVRIESLGK